MYIKGDAPHTFETMPFYLETLRRFLQNHLGKVVWIKGAIIEKPAYLLFHSSLSEKIWNLLVKPLKDGGAWEILPVKHPVAIATKYLREERLTVGYLELPHMILGRPSSVMPKANVDHCNGLWLNEEILLRSDDAYEATMGNEIWTCFVNAVELHFKPDGKTIAHIKKIPRLWIRSESCRFNPTFRKSLEAEQRFG